MAKSRGDSVPIKPYKTEKGVEYLPYPYGPMPKAHKKIKSEYSGKGPLPA